MGQKKYSGILFDFDGTLADTMSDNLGAWQKAFAEFGIALHPMDFLPFEGMKLEEFVKSVFAKYNKPPGDPATIARQKDLNYLADHTFRFFPGVETFVEKLAVAGVKAGIVTAAKGDRLQRSVPKHFLDKFGSIITGDKIPLGKPHPDQYLAGARELALSPTDCIVVENAPLGIQAAKTAGAFCIGITSTLERSFLAQADIVVERFAEIEELVEIKSLLDHK